MMSIADKLISIGKSRLPDFTVGSEPNPYLRRWYLIPENRIFNIYLHQFLKSDEDRAHHDHPWPWMSILLKGSYKEHTIAKGGIEHIKDYEAGSVRIHRAKFTHRLELEPDKYCWTLFITGPRLRPWGFHCPKGWVPWESFVDPKNGGLGKGCD